MERLLLLIEHTNKEQLATASEAIVDRARQIQRIRAAKARAALVPNETRVRTMNLKPKWLNGISGTYIEPSTQRRGDIRVRLDRQPVSPVLVRGRRKTYQQTISVPASCVEILDA